MATDSKDSLASKKKEIQELINNKLDEYSTVLEQLSKIKTKIDNIAKEQNKKNSELNSLIEQESKESVQRFTNTETRDNYKEYFEKKIQFLHDTYNTEKNKYEEKIDLIKDGSLKKLQKQYLIKDTEELQLSNDRRNLEKSIKELQSNLEIKQTEKERLQSEKKNRTTIKCFTN